MTATHFIPHTGRPKFDFRTTSAENFKQFKKDNPDMKHINEKKWRAVLLTFSEMFKEYTLETGELMSIPGDCGKLVIKKRKNKKHVVDKKTGKIRINLPVDWKKSKELKKKVYMMNYHTDGHYFMWSWIKKINKVPSVKFATIWKFSAMKDARKQLNERLNVDEKYQHIYKHWLNL